MRRGSASRTLRTLVGRLPAALRDKIWHLGQLLGYPVDFSTEDIAMCEAVADYTMTSPERVIGLRDAVRYISRAAIPGDVVECGVWRGGSVMVAARTLLEAGDTARTLYLFDTFEGMTTPTGHDRRYDGAGAGPLMADNPNYRCIADESDVSANVLRTGYPADQVRLVKGDVLLTIPRQAPQRIALLRLDTDFYESTRHELVHLYERVSTGGVVIVDDYGHWAGARQAVDDFMSTLNPVPLMSRLDYTGRMWVKP